MLEPIMSNLICVKTKGIEIAVDTKTGERFITIAGYSRLTGVNNGTIRQRCRRMILRQQASLTATEPRIAAKPFCWSDAMRSIQLDTGRGVFRTILIPLEKIAVWIKKDNPQIAKEIQSLIELKIEDL